MSEYKFDCSSYEQAKEGHKYLWSYLAESGDFNKPDLVAIYAINGCYACQFSILLAEQYGIKNKYYNPVCSLCPVLWKHFNPSVGTEDYQCEDLLAPYYLWRTSLSTDLRKKYAAIIKDLPWIPEEELINKAESLRESQSLTIE